MAERSAHMVSALQDLAGPSIFDVLAQESLMSGLRPALNFLTKYLAANFPDKCRILLDWFDEIYAGLDLVLENHYLKRYSASFSENFYGIKRVVASNGKYLTGSKHIRSLVFLVFAPYLKLKFDRLYERLKVKRQTTACTKNESKLDKLMSAFLAAYPMISAGLEIWTLILQLAYVISRSHVHSPWLIFAGVRLANLTPKDLAYFGESKLDLPPGATLLQRIYYLFRLLSQLGFRVMSRLLGVGLFFLQFLDWWFTSDEAPDPRSLNKLPKPPAPQLVCSENQVVKLDPKLCPICRKCRRNDTVLATSGYVFCYGCIHRYLQTNKCCPVTKQPASAEHLIRLFAQATS